MKARVILTFILLVLGNTLSYGGVSPNNVAVIVNAHPGLNGASIAVGRYYCHSAGIPELNIIEIYAPMTEQIYQQDWNDPNGWNLSGQIRSKLISQFGVNPNDPANDPIQVLVMCYGVPSKIEPPLGADNKPLSTLLTQERVSVDAFLTLLFNNGANGPDIGPDLIDGDCDAEALGTQWYHGTQGVPCPYSGKDEDFATFRTSADNDITYLSAKDNLTHHWKMRYLVCRLDAYDDKMVNVDGYGTMPQDVKNIIDRAHNSAGKSGKFILDEPWNFDGRAPCYAAGKAALMSIVDPAKIIRDDNLSQSQIFLNQDNVICYSSFGMHDADILAATQWGRPHNSWVDGSLAIIGESGACESLRYPHHAYGYSSITGLTGERKLRVILGTGSYFQGYRVALCKYSSVPLDDVNDNSDNLISATATLNEATGQCMAEIDLQDASINWPADHKTRVQIYYPNNDEGYHDGQKLMWTNSSFSSPDYIYNQMINGNGVQLELYPTRQKSVEYIRDGCTGIAGPVAEAYSGGVADCNIIFPCYAKGYSWAEAAYMGCARLGFKGLMVGDPLMAPYSASPSINFVSPTPSENAIVNGRITLRTSALPDGNGNISQVMFWLKCDNQPLKLIGVDTQAPFECIWNSQEMKDGNRIYPDGNYAIQAVAQQSGARVGTKATNPLHVVVNSVSCPTVTLENPSDDWPQSQQMINASTAISAAASADTSSVEFWLLGGAQPIMIERDDAGPNFNCAIDQSTSNDGIYYLQAIAYNSQGMAYSDARRILLNNSAIPVFYNILDAASQPDNSEMYIGYTSNGPVTTTETSANMDGAFYIEDMNRASAIRIKSNKSISRGKLLALRGRLHQSTSDTERFIDTTETDSDIWDLDEPTNVPKPLGFSSLWSLGGVAPSNTPGINQTPTGPYNIGQLVRIWGRVDYVGDDFFYVDNGDGLEDGYAYNIVAFYQSTPAPTDPAYVSHLAKGVCVRYSGKTKAKIGDYVSITGISSCKERDGSRIRYIRIRDDNDVETIESPYTTSYVSFIDGKFYDNKTQSQLNIGTKVRIFSVNVTMRSSDYVTLRWAGTLPPNMGYFNVQGITNLPVEAVNLLAFGTILDVGINNAKITPDVIYYDSTQPPGIGILSLGTPAWAASALSVSTRSDNIANILSSESFQRLDSRSNCIGWAISQPDGSVVDLIGEYVSSRSADGGSFGIKEIFEPSTGQPRLVLNLPVDVPQLASCSTIDIIGGRLATLSSGQRAILYPQAIYVNTTAAGNLQPPMWSKQYDSNDLAIPWQWRDQVYPY